MGKGRKPCCDKAGVKKGPWSHGEDLKLISFIQNHGHSNWRALPKLAGLARCGKSCRLRWVNYLRPDLKRGNFTLHEEETIIKLHQELGNKWSLIASKFPGRTDNEIKNVWNTHLKKRIKAKESEQNSPSSCNSPPTSTSTDEPLVESAKDTTEHSLIPQTSTVDDTMDNSSSSSTSYASSQPPFLDHDMKDLAPILNEASVNNSLHELIEIPFEPDLDIWDLLDADQTSSTNLSGVKFSEDDTSLNLDQQIDNLGNDIVNNAENVGNWWWLVYLENELGLDHNEASPTQSTIGSNHESGHPLKGVET